MESPLRIEKAATGSERDNGKRQGGANATVRCETQGSDWRPKVRNPHK